MFAYNSRIKSARYGSALIYDCIDPVDHYLCSEHLKSFRTPFDTNTCTRNACAESVGNNGHPV